MGCEWKLEALARLIDPERAMSYGIVQPGASTVDAFQSSVSPMFAMGASQPLHRCRCPATLRLPMQEHVCEVASCSSCSEVLWVRLLSRAWTV
jgi:hypothetical protein